MMPALLPLPVVITGHVDHGKSTLIGRMLYDTDSLPEGKFEEIAAICKNRGVPFEWSYLLDAFQAERDQAITIDTTQIRFKSAQRSYVIIDAPGHREFLKNMISGAAQAEAAVLVVDATEGVREQTRRHAYLLKLIGIRQIAVVVNKMDKVEYNPEIFADVSRQVQSYLDSIGLQAAFVIPVSASEGDMVARRAERLAWYTGKTLIEALDAFEGSASFEGAPLRFPVQDVYRFDERRILVGRIESGIVRKGDTLVFSPTNEKAVVTSIESWPVDGGLAEARAGQSIGLTLSERIFVERGHIASHDKNMPILSNVFRATLFWMADAPLKVGNIYKARIGTAEVNVSVQSIDSVLDTQDLARRSDVSQAGRNMVVEATFRSRDRLALDPHDVHARLGRIVLYEGHDVCAGGTIGMQGYPDQRIVSQPKSQNITAVHHAVTPETRAARHGHRGAVFWFTGLSGAGKSTLAMAVEKELFERFINAYVLDGDNIRHGLNSDLGFSPAERTENIRRVGEVAALQADAGLVVLTAFISPYQEDRDRARAAAPKHFHEIYVRADLQTCEQRDPKGLYKKARSGQIAEFTGIDSPYQAPLNPDLVVDTQHHDIATCVAQIVTYIIAHVQSAHGPNKEKIFVVR